jgi:hypothetical protein
VRINRSFSRSTKKGPLPGRSPVEDPPERQGLSAQELTVVLDAAPHAFDLGKHQSARVLFSQHRPMMT